MVYPHALFGADVELSDQLIPQYDHAPGESMGICLEGGVQSFLQVLNMLHLNVPVLAVEQLRGPINKACHIDGNYLLFFSAAELLHLIKKAVEEARREGRQITPESIEKIRDNCIHNPLLHGPYHVEDHKHLHVSANPARHDYGTKMDLFVKAFALFFEHRIWEKLELLTVINCEPELQPCATATSVRALLASSLSLYSQRVETSVQEPGCESDGLGTVAPVSSS